LGKLAKPTQGTFNIIDIQQLPINGTILIKWSPTSVEHVNIHRLLPFFEHYNWGHKCCTSVIMTLLMTHSHFDTWHHNKISKARQANNMTCDSKSVNLTHFRRLLICDLFSRNTSQLHDNLRRVSKSPLLHPFTHRRSGKLDWRVTRATSADSSRLIHTILAHSSTGAASSTLLLFYCSLFYASSLPYHSTLCHHRTFS
jgi:hypothetical protein